VYLVAHGWLMMKVIYLLMTVPSLISHRCRGLGTGEQPQAWEMWNMNHGAAAEAVSPEVTYV
jgi:hypothetical protein